jgi:hypothetical protein
LICLTDFEAAQWCGRIGISTSRDSADRGAVPLYVSHSTACEFLIPDAAGRRLWLTRLSLVLACGGTDEDRGFEGALIWLRDWDIGPMSFEEIGWESLRCVRGMNGETRDLATAPAMLFSSDEEVMASMVWSQPVLHEWDAYLIPPGGQLFVFASHDGPMWIVARDDNTLNEAIAALSEGNVSTERRSWPDERRRHIYPDETSGG